MRTLTNTLLFNMFTSYMTGSELMSEDLPAAYDDFANQLAELSQDEDRMKLLRRLNYTEIELSFMQQTCNVMTTYTLRCVYQQDSFIIGNGDRNNERLFPLSCR